MKRSTDRIVTTHVGSLPRSQEVADFLLAQDRGDAYDASAFEAALERCVLQTVGRQRQAGVDIVGDGETSKISYGTYVRHRLTGFAAGRVPPFAAHDLDDFPQYRQTLVSNLKTGLQRLVCRGPVAYADPSPLRKDIRRLEHGVEKAGAEEAFMTACSPGTIAMFQPNEHYDSESRYLEALGNAMRSEYAAIADAGFLLQVDCPDLAMGRHTTWRHLTDDEFLRHATLRVEVLNDALARIAPDRLRLHVCWGNYEGPHTRDIPLTRLLPLLFAARPAALLIEGANPRHEHEWEIWKTHTLPPDKVLVPGVIDSTCNFVEHPELVAQRILRYAGVVGRERVIAGSDCGFGTLAGHAQVDAEICWAKLAALAEGAAIASSCLWERAASVP